MVFRESCQMDRKSLNGRGLLQTGSSRKNVREINRIRKLIDLNSAGGVRIYAGKALL